MNEGSGVLLSWMNDATLTTVPGKTRSVQAWLLATGSRQKNAEFLQAAVPPAK
jgi:hypothetical protein